VTERLSVSKRAAQKSDMERFNLKNLNNVYVKEQYQVKISNRFVPSKNVEENEDIKRTSEISNRI